MSLDVYLEGPRVEGECAHFAWCDHCGREFPPHPYTSRETYYSANITHNLGRMAAEAGIYEALWRPKEMDPAVRARIKEQSDAGNYHGPGGAFAVEDEAPTVYARDLVDPLRAGLALLKSDPSRFAKYNAENGWGLYKNFVPFVEKYLAACVEHPDAIVVVSR